MSYDFLKNKNNLRCSVEKLKTKTKFVFLLFDFLPKNKLYVIHLFISANNARIVCKTFGEKLFVIGWGEWIFQEIMNPCLTWLREGREWLFRKYKSWLKFEFRSLIQELADYEKMPEGPKITAEDLIRLKGTVFIRYVRFTTILLNLMWRISSLF